MSDALVGMIITAITAIIVAAVPPSIIAYRGLQEAKRAAAIAANALVAVEANTVATVETKAIVEDVGRKTDGQLAELVSNAKAVADAAGFLRGVTETKAATDEVSRVEAKSAADRAEGLAQGRAELQHPPGQQVQ